MYSKRETGPTPKGLTSGRPESSFWLLDLISRDITPVEWDLTLPTSFPFLVTYQATPLWVIASSVRAFLTTRITSIYNDVEEPALAMSHQSRQTLRNIVEDYIRSHRFGYAAYDAEPEMRWHVGCDAIHSTGQFILSSIYIVSDSATTKSFQRGES